MSYQGEDGVEYMFARRIPTICGLGCRAVYVLPDAKAGATVARQTKRNMLPACTSMPTSFGVGRQNTLLRRKGKRQHKDTKPQGECSVANRRSISARRV